MKYQLSNWSQYGSALVYRIGSPPMAMAMAWWPVCRFCFIFYFYLIRFFLLLFNFISLVMKTRFGSVSMGLIILHYCFFLLLSLIIEWHVRSLQRNTWPNLGDTLPWPRSLINCIHICIMLYIIRPLWFGRCAKNFHCLWIWRAGQVESNFKNFNRLRMLHPCACIWWKAPLWCYTAGYLCVGIWRVEFNWIIILPSDLFDLFFFLLLLERVFLSKSMLIDNK